MPQNKFWINDSSGVRTEIQGVYVRDADGIAFPISEIWMRDMNGVPHKVFPTGDEPTDTSIFQESFFTTCEISGSRALYPAFGSEINVDVPTIPTQGTGLSNSIWFYQAFGFNSDTWTNYGRFKWTSTADNVSGDNPLDGLDWGFFGSIVRRVPKVDATVSTPSEYVTRLWVRPSTVDHLSVWDTNNRSFLWDDDSGTFTLNSSINRTLNVPSLSNTVEYYEYISQGNLGEEGPSSDNIQPDCCFNTTAVQGKYNFRTSNDGGVLFTLDSRFYPSLGPFDFGTYVQKTPTIPFLTIDDSVSPADNSGKWVVIEKYIKTETGNSANSVYCSNDPADFTCNKSTADASFSVEKEIIVAFVSNKVNGTGVAYDFETDYTGDSDDTDFYAKTAGSGSDRWFSWDGDGNVFLFIRYRTSCFGQLHKNSAGELVAFTPEIKEFWVQPKAWPRVSGGSSWSSNYIGMVMTTIPSVYTDPCRPSGLQQSHLNLPKYFYWNIPLNTCDSATPTGELVPLTFLPNTTDEWAWGTPSAFHTWSNSTGRQDLIGAGVGTNDWGDFNPDPTHANHPNSPESGYEYELLQFNRDNGSIDGFPYGVGHSYGSDILSPAPWCACTKLDNYDGDSTFPGPAPPSGSLECPCSSEWSGTTLLIPNKSNKCCSSAAQQTQIYLLDKTQEDTPGVWDHTSWASGVPTTVKWSNCAPTGDGLCEECGDVDCGDCNVVNNKEPNCNCATCCDCVTNNDAFCGEVFWDKSCVDIAIQACLQECSDCPGF